MDSITNWADQTFTIGARVRHLEGWEGTIVGIKRTTTVDLLLVQPDDPRDLSARDYYRLNSEHTERFGRTHFCRPLDRGMSMGNYTPLP
jgi:hypothetical protein